MRKSVKILTATVCSAVVIAGFGVGTYLYTLPKLVSSAWLNKVAVKEATEFLKADLSIKTPKLTTSLSPNVGFTLEELTLTKNNKQILVLNNLDTEFSFKDIWAKRIIVKKLFADNIFVNASDLMAILPKQEQKEEKPSEFNLDLFSTIFGVRKCVITYNMDDVGIKFDAQNILLDRTKAKKYLHFDFDFFMTKGQDKIQVSADDKHCIYMGNGELHIDKFPIEIDKSKIVIDAFASRKAGMNLNISSKNFSARDIYNIAASNIIMPNGKEMLAPICDVSGSVDFNVHLTSKNIRGDINVNESEFKIKDLMKMPVKITQGIVEIGNKDITLKDFKGYYNNKTNDTLTMEGSVKDYWKTCDTKIVSDIFVNDDFFRDYVSKMLGSPISLVGDAGSRLTLTSKNGSCDILWYFLLKEGEGFKLGDQSMVLQDYKTLFKVDLSVVKNILKINTIDYFITNELKKGMTPVLSINGNLDMADNMKLQDIHLKIPRPLPSEFLNFLAGQKIFKKGTITGEMGVINTGEFPVMEGVITLDKVRIPSQRLFIKSAKIGAKGDKLGAIAEGRFKRSKYNFKGYIVNDLRLPIIVKYVDLDVDNIDLERFLANSQASVSASTSAPTLALPRGEGTVQDASDSESDNVDVPTFQKGLIIVEKCMLNLENGKYKNVNFGNLHANLTLDKDGILNLQSNKFDIAEGISTLKVRADLIKNKYYLRLGVKDVNSTVMADALLGLPREISGKAMGLVEINSDASLKLNGDIKFNIQNGTIEKIGYVEYILKVASLFRNPLVMISPTTFGDLVNIPDGKFDVIKGELKLKDNVIERMMIKSSAKQLGSFIIGRYDLNTNDASLRIYTKMSNKGEGFAGFLRNISLNSLANKISSSERNEGNYYSSEIEQIPQIDADEKDAQIFLTKVDGDVINFNFLSSLKRIK